MRFEALIDGMLAVHAKYALFTALAAVEGLTRAEVELGRAELDVAPDADPEAVQRAVAAAVEQAGFRLAAFRALPRALPML